MKELDHPWQREHLALDVRHPKLQEAGTAVMNWCTSWFRRRFDRSLLVMTGPPGCGKTHLARRAHWWAGCAAINAWDSGGWHKVGIVPTINYRLWPEVSDGFKRGEYDVVDDLCEDAMVILDDIGADHDPSRVAVDKLCQILTHRERKHTMVTTNIPVAEWTSRWDSRIADRLLRNSVVVDLTGVPSYQEQ